MPTGDEPLFPEKNRSETEARTGDPGLAGNQKPHALGRRSRLRPEAVATDETRVQRSASASSVRCRGRNQRTAPGIRVRHQWAASEGSGSDQVCDGGMVTSGSFTELEKVAVEMGEVNGRCAAGRRPAPLTSPLSTAFGWA